MLQSDTETKGETNVNVKRKSFALTNVILLPNFFVKRKIWGKCAAAFVWLNEYRNVFKYLFQFVQKFFPYFENRISTIPCVLKGSFRVIKSYYLKMDESYKQSVKKYVYRVVIK